MSHKCANRPSWPGGVDATSKKRRAASECGADGVVVLEIEQPPRLRLRRNRPSWPGGAIAIFFESCL